MAYATDRVIMYSRTYVPMGDLAPDEVISRVRHEVINLEHTLTLVTTRPLAEGTRLLTQDGTGKWREWVVSTPDDKHETGEHAIGTYVCIWSLQYDLMGCDDGAHAEPGMGSSCTGALAVAAAIDGTDRWEVGSVDVAAVEAGKGCVMTIGKTAWERMSLVVDKWGGEVDAEIEVDSAGVVSRAVALRAHLGQTSVTRRFDWGHDLKSIRRTPEPGPRYCGIVPLGRGQTEYAEDDETTFEWPLTLTGDPEYYPEYTEDYILDPEASLAFRVPDGNGGWEYPKKTVTYDTDDVGELYELASADLHDQTHPKVTYEGDVLQFAAAGMEAQGVQLGDDVQTVDHGFAADAPLRIQGRVVELEVNELSPRTDTHLVIGYVPETVASLLSSTISSAVTPLSRRISRIEGDTSIVHLQDLIDAMNAEINATGGWWYAVPGLGTRTYDTAVTDPAVGTEASKVVEIRGGSIRIANSRTSGGDWDWKTLIVSGHIAAELVTAVNVTAGWIGNPSGTTFFDIDNDQLVIGGRTESQIMDELDSAGIDKIEYGTSASSSTAPSTWSETVPSSVSKGSWLWIRTTYNDGGTSVVRAYAGEDGTSVTILGSYNTLADLQQAHPTGNAGDGYIVAGDLYVWDGSAWEDVGTIQGPAGQDGTSVTISSREVKYAKGSSGTTAPSSGWQDSPPSTSAGEYLWSRTTVTYSDNTSTVTYNVAGHGADGTGVTVSSIQYGVSSSASTQPTSWSTTVPTSIAKGKWLWVRTNYSNGSTATTKSYVGTDGEDGTSVQIQSATKSGDTTTVVITDGTTTSTLTIVDGEDGTNGTNGASGYVHTAWANSADGQTDFSTSVSTGKTYLGVYTDHTAADSQLPSSYSWSLIKGATGAKGDKGDKGDTGDAARSYQILVSPDTLVRDGDAITPSQITVSATVAAGTATPQIYMGRFRVEEHDGSAWSTKYTSSSNESSKTYQPTSTARMVRCTLFAAGGTSTTLDTQTIPVLADGQDGTDGTNGVDGKDAYSVWLTNDSHTFPASNTAALSGSVNTYIKVYKGTTLVRPVIIGTLPTVPTGMTLTRLNNGSSTADAGLRISVTTSLTTRSGTIDIPITADGQSFTVTFSWALALKGDTGSQGAQGQSGVSIIADVPQYYLSTSYENATGGSWSDTPQAWSAGRYYWTRHKITWSTGSTTYSDAVYDAALTQANQQAAQAIADAAEAAKTATNYLTFNQQDGLDVGYENTDAKVNVSGSGVDITDENGTSMTHVQAGKMRLGESAKMRAEIDYHSLQLIDKEGRTYFHASDLRDASGNATITEKMVASGETSTFYLRLDATSTSYTIKVGSSYVSASTKTVSYFTLSTRPTKGTVVEVTYTTTDYRAKAFTAGIRSNSYPTGAMSFAEGNANEASGYCSHAEGNSSHAVGSYSHAEGFGSNATGIQSHAEGNGCTASGEDSHSEGYCCTASGFAAHAEGRECAASGSYSHAEGYNCTASWDGAHAGGYNSQASQYASFVHGIGLKVSSQAQAAFGKYNSPFAIDGVFYFGNGTSDSNRSNGAYVSGTQVVAGSFINSSDERIKTDIESLDPDDAVQFIRSLMPRSYVKQGTRELGFVAQEVERDEAYGDILVGQDTNYGYDDFRILNYQGIIAPLVAYAQNLERQVESLTERLCALEGKVS